MKIISFKKILYFFSFFSLLSSSLTSSYAQTKAKDSLAPGETIKVGAVFPMTGNSATYGQESYNGIKLGLLELNKKGVKGHKVEVVLEDDKGEPVESANAVRKLITVDNVKAIVGSVASSNTLAGAPIAQESKVPLLTPASTNEKVTQTGEYVARICFTDNFQGEVMAKFAYTKLKAKKAVIVVDNSSDYSKGLASVFRQKFTQLGGVIVSDDLAYQQKDVEFRSLLRKVKRTNADVIFLPGYYQEVGLILNQARKQGIMVPILGGDGWDSPTLQKLAGAKGVENTYISSHFSADDTDPLVKSFVDAYVKAYQVKPGAMAALGYDVILVLGDAIARAKAITPEEIKNAINTIKDFKGVSGNITLDANRNAVKSAVVLKVTSKGNVFEEKVQP